jgi:hypothetical protein
MRRPSQVTIALSVTVAAIAAGYGLYRFADARRLSTSSVAVPEQWTAMQTEPVGEPLLVANPFDSTEVFEFPAGTSEADAHEAIAGFLLERATRRGVGGGPRHSGPKS